MAVVAVLSHVLSLIACDVTRLEMYIQPLYYLGCGGCFIARCTFNHYIIMAEYFHMISTFNHYIIMADVAVL